MEQHPYLTTDVIISEIQTWNDTTLQDQFEQYPPWIELWNRGDSAVNLQYWGLTDNPAEPYKWQFPQVTIQPAEFLIVFATGVTNGQPPSPEADPVPAELHTNFVLNEEGGFLALVPPESGLIAFSIMDYPSIPKDWSYSYFDNISDKENSMGSQVFKLTNPPTPGQENDPDNIAKMAVVACFRKIRFDGFQSKDSVAGVEYTPDEIESIRNTGLQFGHDRNYLVPNDIPRLEELGYPNQNILHLNQYAHMGSSSLVHNNLEVQLKKSDIFIYTGHGWNDRDGSGPCHCEHGNHYRRVEGFFSCWAKKGSENQDMVTVNNIREWRGSNPEKYRLDFKLVWLNACRTFEGPNEDWDEPYGPPQGFGSPPDPSQHTWKTAFNTQCFIGWVNIVYSMHAYDIDNVFWRYATMPQYKGYDTVKILDHAKLMVDSVYRDAYERHHIVPPCGQIAVARAAGRVILNP